ncbi:Isoprenylcysteine carboxyl methyltransferase family-domain-containing protein [Microdochium trichocladiopsis]|uniref:Protein-S-isoprenylcysteine O-methyltransferase n=1 Tax=Microdochium trichocladiopsis TaxID=1682393 RepID=A0A9P9BG55_9PEZI|nr:Isoprenylcysteine carboxyl methyltransferase family-domain-containing protein [Microdochium trichocladiopsis]KAH7014324.1 Isoprenylcysteine carboxyl methyltransferase family-domain-containing protein [Microdochium trichocladiopsis]
MLLASAVLVTGWIRTQWPSSPHWRTPFFLAATALMHALDLWATTRCVPSQVSRRPQRLGLVRRVYVMAYAFATAECIVLRHWYWTYDLSNWFPYPIVWPLSWIMVVGGQLVRVLAILHGGPSYPLGEKRRCCRSRHDSVDADHQLVTTGIYGWIRHPAYFGYFWWAIGTQLILANRMSLLAFVIVLWSFFAGRIHAEEEALVRRHGSRYENYQHRVGVWIPFTGN